LQQNSSASAGLKPRVTQGFRNKGFGHGKVYIWVVAPASQQARDIAKEHQLRVAQDKKKPLKQFKMFHT
jgi:hypothetical protein